MCAVMLRQSRTSKRSSALDAADVACSCILVGMSVSSTVAFPSSILLARVDEQPRAWTGGWGGTAATSTESERGGIEANHHRTKSRKKLKYERGDGSDLEEQREIWETVLDLGGGDHPGRHGWACRKGDCLLPARVLAG